MACSILQASAVAVFLSTPRTGVSLLILQHQNGLQIHFPGFVNAHAAPSSRSIPCSNRSFVSIPIVSLTRFPSASMKYVTGTA